MITHKLTRLPKHTFEILVHITKDEIEKEYKKAFDILHKELAVEGFRKGKVPKELAEKNLQKETVYQQLMKSLLPRAYQEIVEKEKLKPVVSPKVDLIKAKEGEDWEVKMTIAEKPLVDLGDYKSYIKDVKTESKKAEIWVPGKDQTALTPEQQEKNKQNLLNSILGKLLDQAKVEIPEMVIEDELEARLSRLVDDVQKVGLTTEAYLKSKNITIEDLRNQIRNEIEGTYKMEFILDALAEKENVTVEPDELNKLFGGIKDEKEKKSAQANAYFYASILRKQKTLDLLTSL